MSGNYWFCSSNWKSARAWHFINLQQVDLTCFLGRAELVSLLGREAAKRVTKSREVFVLRHIKWDKGLFWKSRHFIAALWLKSDFQGHYPIFYVTLNCGYALFSSERDHHYNERALAYLLYSRSHYGAASHSDLTHVNMKSDNLSITILNVLLFGYPMAAVVHWLNNY